MDIREAIRTQPMRPAQFLIVFICIVLTMIDGYEIVVMPFVMPHLAKAWVLGPVEVGYLLSASVFGMALGALVISPFADKIGRRNHISLCLLVITIGMLLSAFANTIFELVAYRAFAGLFIGGIVSSISVLASEYSSDKRRGTVMGVYGIGLPLGSALAGLVINPLTLAYDWRAPFILGGLLTLVMLIVVYFVLPESIDYLIEKRPKNALLQYQKIAKKLGYPHEGDLPLPIRTNQKEKVMLKMILGGIMLRRTLCLWFGYAGLSAAFYFANTWTAKIISDVSGDETLGAQAGVLIQVGGVVGALFFAALSLKIRPRIVTVIFLFLGALTYTLYATQMHNITVALFLAAGLGMFANGSLAAFYAISPSIYPAAVRGTGVGWMIGFARGVAILAPIFTGYMLKAGWTPAMLYQFFGTVLIVSTVIMFLLDLTYKGRSENPETPELKI